VTDRPALLDEPYSLAPGTVETFETAGHAVVRGLASPALVEQYKPAIDEATMALRWDKRPLEERDTYGRAFIQSANVHRHSATVAEFALARRFARVAAELLQCDGVRLYHDQALYKEPGGGFTPWHQDQVYWPLDSDRTITMWMPLVDIPRDVGGMTFADGSWRHGNLGELVIGDASHEYFDTVVAERGFIHRRRRHLPPRLDFALGPRQRLRPHARRAHRDLLRRRDTHLRRRSSRASVRPGVVAGRRPDRHPGRWSGQSAAVASLVGILTS